MARSGSFGGSLNPFGSGGSGGFSGYDIASNLAELELYRVEVAWGNGTATDDEYLSALRKAVDATLPDSKDRESATNRLFDAEYRIGRNKADLEGLDALIAFDQASLAKMDPGNLKYRTIQESLDSELAQRRSRDYGDLVRRYNNGEISTQKLVDWVQTALKGVSEDDPDYDNWTGTLDDLEERVQSEADEKVYQDYQQGRMKGPEFVAYLRGRLDDYQPESPQYADWARKVEDATKSVKRDELAKQDQAFFNAYELGKKSDKAYLTYLRTRLGSMDADDPDLPEWKQRLTQAVFSLAEDKLRFDVSMGKAPASKLRSFYVNYRRTLNPGSKEWRDITLAIKQLGGASSGGGGRSSGGGGGGGGAKGKTTQAKPRAMTKDDIGAFVGKVISDGVLPAILSQKSKVAVGTKAARSQEQALRLNRDAAQTALKNGDKVWLFTDPSKPKQMVAMQRPDGTVVKGADGKPVMIRGAGYLPATNIYTATLTAAMRDMEYAKAADYQGKNDTDSYFTHLRYARGYEDDLRRDSANQQAQSSQKFYDAAFDAIEDATKTGDLVTAFNIARQVKETLAGQRASDPYINDDLREKLDGLEDKLDGLDILPKTGPDGQQIGGVIDINGSSFDANGNMTSAGKTPGWHFILDKNPNGQGTGWGWDYDQNLLSDEDYNADRLEVHTTYGGKVVTGSVKIGAAATNPTTFAKLPDGSGQIRLTGTDVLSISYVDEHGKTVRAYSLDGETWVRSLNGTVPSMEIDTEGLTLQEDYETGGKSYFDKDGTVVFRDNGDGSWEPNKTYFKDNPDKADWYGMKDLRKRQANLGRVATRKADGTVRQGQFVSGDEERYLYGAGRLNVRGTTALGGAIGAVRDPITGEITKSRGGGGVSVGAPGQAMQVVVKSPSGQVNLTGSSGWGDDDNGYRGTVRRPGGEDSFAPAKQTAKPKFTDPTKRTGGSRTTRAAEKARLYGEDARDLLAAPTGSNVNARTGFTIPSVRSQLPADTPERFDGEGFTRVPTSIPTLKSYGSTSTPVPRLTTGSTIPPALKTTKVPLPRKKTPVPTKGFKTPKNTTGRKAPTVKKVRSAVASTTRLGMS